MPESARVFFAYPSQPPSLVETLWNACQGITKSGIPAMLWEDLEISGRMVIDRVLKAIDESEVSVFEITNLNQNVMFELGYAIGSDKKVWILRNESIELASTLWDQVKILTTVGYTPYTNYHEVQSKFFQESPHEKSEPVFSTAIRPNLRLDNGRAIFLVRSQWQTNADIDLYKTADSKRRKSDLRLLVADPRESSVESLYWYAQQVWDASAVLIHFSSPSQKGATVHNARCAFIAGLARGMGRSVLMFAESDYSAPIDYRDLLYIYRTAKQCAQRASEWLETAIAQPSSTFVRPTDAPSPLDTLRSIRLGEHVAENEEDRLEEYFIETASFLNAISESNTLFVGRRGVGKTANLIQASIRLEQDKRNLVVIIRPF